MLKSLVGLSVQVNRVLRFNQFARMATLSIGSGLAADTNLQNCQIVFAGQNKHLKALKLDATLNAKLMGVVNENTFQLALRALPSKGNVPLYLDYAKFVSTPDDASRHNSPSNAHALFKGIQQVNIVDGIKKLCIVLFSEYSHVMANVAAISKCFPLFSRKTSSPEDSPKLEAVVVEVVVTDEKKLTDEDVKFLQSLTAHRGICQRKTIIKGEDLRTEGFGGIYNVGKAAVQPPIFVCLSHTPACAKESFAMVGKGIVFDTGGMQIKPSSSMLNMKKDMGGAAACLTAFLTLVKSGFRENLHCLLCIAENNISPVANKPDDIITL
uniref:Cytosol aminopeptidase domain-containing protein n=1 Tax=Ditylenchus dipsaci TaxID=166011 RepID=A0A915CRT9_9BILA